jgi:colicin import membrane protein
MESTTDKLRAFLMAVGFHALCVLLLYVGLSWTRAARPISVPGPIIEATLVNYAAKPLPPPKLPRAKPTPVAPERTRPEPIKPEVVRDKPELPPVAPRADDTIDREKIDRMALEKAKDAEREQEEKRKRDQELLEQEDQMTRMERERQQQLEDIRKLRQQAEDKRKVEERQLAKIENSQQQRLDDQRKQQEQDRLKEMLEAEQQAGNEGKDEDLLSRYIFSLQSSVTQNWLRPDSVLPGLKCTVRVTQIPGGEVLTANVVSPCNGDEMARRSIEAAVLRAQPLPYQGYEKVFQRSVDFVFSYDG